MLPSLRMPTSCLKGSWVSEAKHGADPNYDYGTHFLFQGHENGVSGYFTRINLDADGKHRVTLMATTVYRFLPKNTADLTKGGKLQALQVQSKAHAGPIFFDLFG